MYHPWRVVSVEVRVVVLQEIRDATRPRPVPYRRGGPEEGRGEERRGEGSDVVCRSGRGSHEEEGPTDQLRPQQQK